MDVKIDISAEQVEAAIKDAIVKSTIGDQIAKAVHNVLSGWKFKDAVEDAVRAHIMEQVRETIWKDPDVQAKIKAAIVEKLGDDFIEATATKIANAASRNY